MARIVKSIITRPGPPGTGGGEPLTDASINAVATTITGDIDRLETVTFDPRKYGAGAVGLTNAIDAMRNVDGAPVGHLVIPTPFVIDAPITINLGYVDVRHQADPANAGSHGERFRLTSLAPFRPVSGIGTALTIKGGYGPILDLQFEGGGGSGITENALHLEDLLGLELRTLSGVGYGGTLLHMDGSVGPGIRTRVALATLGYIYADRCGRALYAKGIEGFGRFDRVWDMGSVSDSMFINCADTGIGHWEGFASDTMQYAIDFQNCNSMNVGILTMGDRAQQAMLRFQGGDFGRINQIRASGKPDGTYLGDGVHLDNLNSIEIDTLHTFRLGGASLRIIGGGGGGIRVKRHISMTSDGEPLIIQPGTGTTPRIDIGADYRNHKRASVKVETGLTGGLLRLRGYTEDMHTVGGASGKYAVDVAAGSSALVLDVAGMHQKARSGLAGFTNHAGVIRGREAAYLGNNLPVAGQAYLTDGVGGLTPTTIGSSAAVAVAQVILTNTITKTAVSPALTIPASSSEAGDAYRITAWGSIDNIAAGQVTLYGRIGGGDYWYAVVSNASAQTTKRFRLEVVLTLRSATGTQIFPIQPVGDVYAETLATPVNLGVRNPGSLTMTSTLTVTLAGLWNTADVGNILRVEGCVIEKVN